MRVKTPPKSIIDSPPRRCYPERANQTKKDVFSMFGFSSKKSGPVQMVKDAYDKGVQYMQAGDPARAMLWLSRADTIYCANDDTYEAVGEALTEDCSSRIGALEEEPTLVNQITAQVEELAEELEGSQLRLWGLMSMARLAQLGKKLAQLPDCEVLGQLETAVRLMLQSFSSPISGQEFQFLESVRDALYDLSDLESFWDCGEIEVPGKAPFQAFDLNGMLAVLEMHTYIDSHLACLLGEEVGAPGPQPDIVPCALLPDYYLRTLEGDISQVPAVQAELERIRSDFAFIQKFPELSDVEARINGYLQLDILA